MSETLPSEGLIDTDVQGEICYVTLRSPDNLNAMDARMVSALRDACAPVFANESTKVIVIRGEGRGFCAGGDLLYISQFQGRTDVALDNILTPLHEFLAQLEASDKIIIFAVHGIVAGAGLSLVSMGDFCIAEQDTKFYPAYASIGLTPDGGGSAGLVRSVGQRWAMHLLLGADRFGLDEAIASGLVSTVAPTGELKEVTAQFAERLASMPKVTLTGTKKLVQMAARTDFEKQLELEKATLATAMREQRFQERLAQISNSGGVV